MSGIDTVREEKKLLGNHFFLAGPRAFVGLRFKFRPPGALSRIWVKVAGLSAGNAKFELEALESGERFSAILPTELSIGVGSRRDDDPLINLLKETGMQFESFLQKRGDSGRVQESGSRREFPEAELRDPGRRETFGGTFGRRGSWAQGALASGAQPGEEQRKLP